jgi:hypothetical protein
MGRASSDLCARLRAAHQRNLLLAYMAAQTKTIALAYGRRRLATSRSPTGGPTTWRSPTGGARQQHRARLRAAQAKGQRAYGHRSGRSERSDTSFMTGAGMPSGINIYIYIYIDIFLYLSNYIIFSELKIYIFRFPSIIFISAF